MKFIRKASEEEMIWAFLSMEYCSDRFRGDIEEAMAKHGISKDVFYVDSWDEILKRIEKEDFFGDLKRDVLKKDDAEARKLLLAEYRGYPDDNIFEGYPKDIKWELVQLEDGDIESLRYVDYSYWNELSKDTGKPTVGAETVNAGITIFDVPNDNFNKGYKALCDGKEFPPLILLTSEEGISLILEGHVRATVYAMKKGSEVAKFAYAGFCDREELKRKDKNC